jgi:hypothetical protein
MQDKNSRNAVRARELPWRALACVLCVATAAPASAAVIDVSLGNASSGLTPGLTTDLITDVLPAQDGQPAPFDQGYGNDSGSDPADNFSATWIFNFAPIVGPISAATIVLGMVDADAGSPGSQVDFFSIAGNDLTGAADSAFELVGGDSSVYQVFSIDLGGILASLASGSVSVTLRLKGPVLSPDFLDPSNLVQEEFNGAHLIFSTLSISSQSTSVPEPGSLLLLSLGLPLIFAARRRVSHVRSS